jgi:hypothetical protein
MRMYIWVEFVNTTFHARELWMEGSRTSRNWYQLTLMRIRLKTWRLLLVFLSVPNGRNVCHWCNYRKFNFDSKLPRGCRGVLINTSLMWHSRPTEIVRWCWFRWEKRQFQLKQCRKIFISIFSPLSGRWHRYFLEIFNIYCRRRPRHDIDREQRETNGTCTQFTMHTSLN